MPFRRVRSWWSLTRHARAGEFGSNVNSRSVETSVLAQKLAVLHPEKPDGELAEELRPLLRQRGVKVTEVLSLLADPAEGDAETYERARQLVRLAVRDEPGD